MRNTLKAGRKSQKEDRAFLVKVIFDTFDRAVRASAIEETQAGALARRLLRMKRDGATFEEISQVARPFTDLIGKLQTLPADELGRDSEGNVTYPVKIRQRREAHRRCPTR